MLIDYHIHNHFSPDSKTNTLAIIEKERGLGVKHLCITNHLEWFEEGEIGTFDETEAVPRFQKTKEELDKLQNDFPDMQLGLGVEIQFDQEKTHELDRFIEKMPFDLILGSIHAIDNVQVSGGGDVSLLFPHMDEKTAYTKYFEEVLRMVKWGNIDATAHFDVVKKYSGEYYGSFKPHLVKPLIIEILQTMKNKGIGMELNTGCLHRKCNELFPHPDILKWCVEIGIENYTLGSDAHELSEVGRYLDEALTIAKEAGIKTISTYKKRKPTKHKI